MAARVANHNFFLLLNFSRDDMVTQALLGFKHLNQLLFEHFVNISTQWNAKWKIKQSSK